MKLVFTVLLAIVHVTLVVGIYVPPGEGDSGKLRLRDNGTEGEMATILHFQKFDDGNVTHNDTVHIGVFKVNGTTESSLIEANETEKEEYQTITEELTTQLPITTPSKTVPTTRTLPLLMGPGPLAPNPNEKPSDAVNSLDNDKHEDKEAGPMDKNNNNDKHEDKEAGPLDKNKNNGIPGDKITDSLCKEDDAVIFSAISDMKHFLPSYVEFTKILSNVGESIAKSKFFAAPRKGVYEVTVNTKCVPWPNKVNLKLLFRAETIIERAVTMKTGMEEHLQFTVQIEMEEKDGLWLHLDGEGYSPSFSLIFSVVKI